MTCWVLSPTNTTMGKHLIQVSIYHQTPKDYVDSFLYMKDPATPATFDTKAEAQAATQVLRQLFQRAQISGQLTILEVVGYG